MIPWKWTRLGLDESCHLRCFDRHVADGDATTLTEGVADLLGIDWGQRRIQQRLGRR